MGVAAGKGEHRCFYSEPTGGVLRIEDTEAGELRLVPSTEAVGEIEVSPRTRPALATTCQPAAASSASNRVRLAYSPLGPRIPGLTAYHTSILVGEREYSFGVGGVHGSSKLSSHRGLASSAETLDMGVSEVSGRELVRCLRPFFKRGTYDLLRKNCNAFSDCALWYLLGVRLSSSYQGLETIGHAVEKAGLVTRLTRGEYSPNPKADAFDLAATLAELAKLRATREGEAGDDSRARREKSRAQPDDSRARSEKSRVEPEERPEDGPMAAEAPAEAGAEEWQLHPSMGQCSLAEEHPSLGI